MKTLSNYSRYSYSWLQVHSNKIVVLFGLALVLGGLTESLQSQTFEPDWDQERIVVAADYLLAVIEGAFGALVMVVAGIAAIVAATMGAYRASVAMLVVAVGSFILRSLVELFFGPEFTGVEDL